MKRITVLGSTGSIGTQTLEIVEAYPDECKVTALAAGKNINLLEQQIRKFHPEYAAVWEEKDAVLLRQRLGDIKISVISGMEGLKTVCSLPETDMVVTAIVGMIGIQPTIAAIKAHKDVALANKETLVCAGHIIMPLSKENHVNIYPVDSEHSAIFQCQNGENHSEIRKILLTASGGPFRKMNRGQLLNVRPEDALKHPNWTMGAKVTIDSSTMVNKGLEVMEARWLFDVSYDDVEVVVQPQSIIHSMVEFNDGAVMAQLGVPDMKLPIQYALFYPRRLHVPDSKRLDLTKLAQLTFEKPDMETFRGLKLAYQAGRTGGNMPTVFNAANEAAVKAFLGKKIGFLNIYEWIEEALNKTAYISNPDVGEILETQQNVNRLLELK